MVRGKRVFPILFLLMLVVVVYATQPIHITRTGNLLITDDGDTAEVMKIHKFTPNDSFDFEFDVEGYGTALGEDSLIKWTSPSQVARIIVTSPLDTTAVYRCSVDMGTTVYGFAYNIVGTDTTMQSFIDSMVDSINTVTGMKDSIVAHDSTANGMIKIIGIIGQQNLENGAKWSLRLTGTEIALGDSVQTTIAMVCDSIAATINAADSVSTKVTGANDGDTVITVTSDKKGVFFEIVVADSSLDTTTITANVNSFSTHIDTLHEPIVGLHRRDLHANGLYATIILKPADSTNRGVGLSDSGFIWLYTVFNDQSTGDNRGQYFLLDSSVSEGLPDTLRVSIPRDSAGVDTLFKDWLAIAYKVKDSTSDTNNFILEYDIQIDLNVYSQ